MQAYAHSGLDNHNYTDYQLLRDHLRAVGEGARQRARDAIPNHPEVAELAFVAGLLHDLGKYRPGFQKRIRGQHAVREATYHKEAGAAKCKKCAPVAFAIAGHHGGLPSVGELQSLVNQYRGQAHLAEILPEAVRDFPELATLSIVAPTIRSLHHFDLLTRLVFSCLVDADWADTADYSRRVRHLPHEPEPGCLQATPWLGRVLDYIAGRAQRCGDSNVAAIRAEVLATCLERAESPPGLFSLTVPTGGGKTLSALAFALKHAAAHGLRRVIYVAPFLTILEQNTRVLREALGLDRDSLDLFEHHSLADPVGDASDSDLERESPVRRAENWDAPVVVTTNVQFFESLFSNKPGRCRKLHNIARSVIVLDECQAIPPGLVAPVCGMLRQVATDLSSTVVLCTATQPAFAHPALKSEERLDASPIVPDSANLFKRLRRVHLVWPSSADERRTWPEVAQLMTSRSAALCVVNTRKAARDLYFAVEAFAGSEATFHLSTSMCPAHRIAVIDIVRARLQAGEHTFLVSTQLIECGVDVDFPHVLREMAPLDAIIQAAGRCNREGLLEPRDGLPGGRVTVFRSVEGAIPPEWYVQGRDIVEQNFLAAGREPQIDEPADIVEYYTRWYRSGELDRHRIQALREQKDYPEIARKFELIEPDGIAAVVGTWNERATEIDTLVAQVRAEPTRHNFRKLAPFQVNLKTRERVKNSACVVEIDPRFALFGWTGLYHPKLGLSGPDVEVVLLV